MSINAYLTVFLYISIGAIGISPQSTPLPSLIASLGLPSCLLDCSQQLILDVDDIVMNQITVRRFKKLCRSYLFARSCVNTTSSCSIHFDLFDDVTSGLHYACVEEYHTFLMFLPCAQVHAAMPNTLIDCQSTCQMNTSIAQLVSSNDVTQSIVQGGNWLDIVGGAGTTCRSLACFLECTRTNFNKYCGNSGSRLAEMVLRPFDRFALQLKSSPADIEQILKSKIPSDCRQFTLTDMMDTIRFDEEFLAKLKVWVETRKRQEISSKRPFIKDTVAKEFRKLVLPPPVPQLSAPAVWTLSFIAYLCFMIFTILLNIVGLAAGVIWCIRRDKTEPAQRRYFQHHLHREQIRVIVKAGEPATQQGLQKRE